MPGSIVAGVCLVSLTLASSAAAAPPGGAGRFAPSPVQGEIVPVVSPVVVGGPNVTVVLELVGDPVALVQAAAGARLGADQKRRIAGDLEARQDAIAEHVRARGGTVLAKFQHAVNGVKIHVPLREVAALAALPGVVRVRPVALVKPTAEKVDNAVGVPFIGAPQVWDGVAGLRGEGIKIAVVDTGIDYTHANFGGPGTVAAFAAAAAASTAPADPALFGPGAPKVKGGTDLVGDDYDAGGTAAQQIPHPDPNPLDCNGHGSHVSGTAAGFGVTADGATFQGPYDAATVASHAWRIGPGVAPRADLYAVRVFGCTGSTNVVVDAIDWAVANDMDVISMSLGSDYGTADTADALASENASRAGIMVVAASGNAGFAEYITSSPAAGNRVIAAAAVDAVATFPGAHLALAPAGAVDAIDANGAPLPATPLAIVVLRNANGTVSLGCSEAEYVDATIAGKLVVTRRGTCARVDRATFGARHGAAAVLMINNAPGLPPFEGDIPNVAIPFLGISNAAAGVNAVLAAASATLSPITLANPGFDQFASFSSGGPRRLDGALKPSIAAPGVSVQSTAIGTGNQGERLSGTSMATPHVSGSVALALQAHPGWSADDVRAALLGTADPAKVLDYEARLGGAGLVQPFPATRTQVVALAQPGGPLNLSFGFAELVGDAFQGADQVTLRNHGSTAVTFDVGVTPTGGSPHTATASRSRVTVRAGGQAVVGLQLTVPAATAGNSDSFRDVAGLLTFTPAGGGNGGVALRVPYYFVPRTRALLEAEVEGQLGPASSSVTARLAHGDGAIDVNADFYAWGPSGVLDGTGSINVRAAGVQAFTLGGRRVLAFAVNNFARFSSAAVNEYDVLIDNDGDGTADFSVTAIDLGLIQTGSFSGQIVSAAINLKTGAIVVRFLATAPSDGSTLLLPVRASDIGVTAATPRFAYSVVGTDLFTGASSATVDTGRFNAFTSAIETGQFVTVPVDGQASVPVAIDAAEWAITPPAGLMIVNLDGTAGRQQADLIKAR